jgi:hypothetical protein
MATSTSCPRCGAGSPALASRCAACGFVFFEQRPRRRPLPRFSWPLAGAALASLALLAWGAVLLTREPEPEPPAPVARVAAERRLETRLAASGVAGIGSVRCAGPVRRGADTRCHLLYADGDTQLMLVSLSGSGELDIAVPYPAQRRPGR